jgi:hypothetical protein
MGADADTLFQKKSNQITVKPKSTKYETIICDTLSRKYGKRVLIIYLCWCILKGVFILYAGYKLLS